MLESFLFSPFSFQIFINQSKAGMYLRKTRRLLSIIEILISHVSFTFHLFIYFRIGFFVGTEQFLNENKDFGNP